MNIITTTEIPSFSLLAKDWCFLANLMRSNEKYNDLIFDLNQKFRIQNPPTGNTSVTIDNQNLGLYFELFLFCNNIGGKEIGKGTRNRFRTALENLNLPEITTFLTKFRYRKYN